MKGMVEAEIWGITQAGDGSMVFLRPIETTPFTFSEYTVPIFIGQLEAQAILIGYGSIEVPRPLTVDLFITIMQRMGLVMLRVEISEIRNNTFFARLILSGNGTNPISVYTEEKPLIVDARPSDALALAVRSACPVYLSEKVLREAGIPTSSIIDADMDDGTEAQCEALKEELDAAVAREDYEKAAKLRDLIISLEKK